MIKLHLRYLFIYFLLYFLVLIVKTVCWYARFLEVCEWLESFIDPFDLDVFTPPLNANLNRLSQRTSVRWPPTSSVAASQAIRCVASHTVLRQMCVSGAAGAVDGLREAVLLTEQQQWHQLSGALQHPAPGEQPDPVRILYSKPKKNYTQLSKSLDTVLSSTGLVCCPSACPMCANPNRPPECPHIRR